jgi:hypothetical protein
MVTPSWAESKKRSKYNFHGKLVIDEAEEVKGD